MGDQTDRVYSVPGNEKKKGEDWTEHQNLNGMGITRPRGSQPELLLKMRS